MGTLSLATLGLLAVITAAEEPSLSPSYFLQFGVLGAVVVAIVWRRWLVPGWSLDDAEKRNTRLEAENAALRMALEEKTARAMDALTEALEELTRAAATPPTPPPPPRRPR